VELACLVGNEVERGMFRRWKQNHVSHTDKISMCLRGPEIAFVLGVVRPHAHQARVQHPQPSGVRRVIYFDAHFVRPP
jgi:hypothetical protein